MKSPRRTALASVALLAALLQTAGAVDARNKRAQARAEARAEAELAVELRGARERRQAEAAEAAASQGVAAAAGDVVAARSWGEGRLAKWAREVRTTARRFCLPLLYLVQEQRREHSLVQGEAAQGPEQEAPASEDMGTGGIALIAWLTSESIYLVLCVLVAYLYKTRKEWFMDQMFKDPNEKDFTKWTSPVLEPVLLWSCLCPGVRWADTMVMSNIVPGYWQAFFLFFAMCMITGLSLGLPGWILMTCFMTFFRMRLRSKYDMEQSLFCDFCGYCWCLPCLVAQEARHVEDAKGAESAP